MSLSEDLLRGRDGLSWLGNLFGDTDMPNREIDRWFHRGRCKSLISLKTVRVRS
jgi:hypothetical protein